MIETSINQLKSPYKSPIFIMKARLFDRVYHCLGQTKLDLVEIIQTLLFDSHIIIILQKLVVKPDQLIKRRGKLGLIKAGTDLDGVKDWLKPRLGKEFTVCKTTC